MVASIHALLYYKCTKNTVKMVIWQVTQNRNRL